MMRPRATWTCILAFIAGLAGGVSSQFLFGTHASAERELRHERTVFAEEFALVDKDAKIYAKVFVTSNDRPALMLHDDVSGRDTLLELSRDWVLFLKLMPWIR
jgi:hypothetical protein